MKRFASYLLSIVISCSISTKVFAEISVPEEVKTMSPTEAYKKGYEDAEKNITSSNTKNEPEVIDVRDFKGELDDSAIGKIIKTQDSEIVINSVSLTKSRDGKDLVLIEYSVTNKREDTTSPSFLIDINVFQEGVEVKKSYITIEGDNSSKKVKTGVTLDKCYFAYEVDPDIKELQLEVGDYRNKVNINVTLD